MDRTLDALDEEVQPVGAAAEDAPAPNTEETASETAESLEQYLREISRWQLLTPEGERAIAKKTAKGDPRALEELIQRNLRLVIYWAKRYRSAGLPLQDLIQEGNIGLMRAAEKFDPRKGTRFSTYASWWIRQALARAICDKQDLIRIPVHMHQKLRRVDRMLERARTKKQGGEIDVERRINASGIVAYKEWESARRLQQPISLDRRADPDREGGIEVEDMNAANPLKDIYEEEVRDYIARLLDRLPPRHRTVVRLRYGMEDGREHTLESIGGRLKISRERVRQIQSEAIERISRIAAEQHSSRMAHVPAALLPRTVAPMSLEAGSRKTPVMKRRKRRVSGRN
ncbi:MAG: RNA polymerase sigma factor RpoD/SigA [Acidobacteria bacterium]|nr:RNA polymerase sigma factor RpoD/SigA [Acidobacteriota bacterium]